MNAESAGQDPEISRLSFVRRTLSENEHDQERSEDYNRKYIQTDQYSLEGDICNGSVKNPSITNVAINAGRNKRKNFNPRYTSGSPMGEENDESPITISHNLESRDNHHFGLMSRSSESPAECPAASEGDVGRGSAVRQTDLPPWIQMLSQYDQFVRTTGLSQYPIPSVSDGGGYAMQEFPASAMPEWARKFGSNELAVSAIHDLLKVYQKRGVNSSQQGGYGSANLPTETEPPTPPTTPHTYHSASRSIILNGSGDHQATTANQSPLETSVAKKESFHQSPPLPILASAMSGSLHTNNYPTNLSTYKRTSPMNESPPQIDHQWAKESAAAKAHNPHQTWQMKESSGDEGHTIKNATDCVNSYNDDSSDYCDPALNTSGGSSSHHLRQWQEDFQNIPESSFDKRIKSECDDTDTTMGDTDNNPYDEYDYPASPTDYPDSINDDEDDDENFSVNTFCDDEISTGDDQMRTSSECDRNNIETVDVDETQSVAAEKESSCSNSSSKIAVRNLGALFDQSQMNLVPSKARGGIEEKGLHDFVQNMSKFTSYLECQNEMCRLENLREHYHCYDFPCFGKIFSKKEEVIRHVKWHRKRVESLNHGFMRFSSSDDCSTTFGSNCPHNRKQTHYHCFQPNCDRVYISTSDVQMHSNFHRKDSAIHKEGFQRFRANEKCSADYCMFSGQKTTHFHCRRDNCRFTFKNKADMEKHKTYHIKDLKLARDGFKKFLKNEQCPYKQCRFSKVCNHIHCARENCFYVLHSSGQLLSHKRKHERLDNEQTYCRYKMLAVKAALLGNAAAAAAAVCPKISPYNLTSSLLRLRDMDIGAMELPRAASEPSLPSPKQELYNKDCVNEPPSSTSLSMEFLQQMKKRHDEMLKQKQHLSTHLAATDVSRDVSMLPVIHQEPNSPQHQYNMGLDHNQLTPSVIQQFFTTECLTQSVDTDDPINLTNVSSNDGKAEKTPCPWKERLEAHLHCIVKDCEAVIPNNVLDMTAHIRLHGYNRDVYATTAAASETLLSSGSNTSNNAMQITTIDGFFNRKRGRPPKNRFVEVYKNAQQSPQAIFTSFKLEKQAVTHSTTCDSAASISHNQPPPTGSLCNDAQQSLSSPLSLAQSANLVQNPLTSQFTTHKANEHCGVGGLRCSLSLQHHYHCICSADCTFVTAERDLLAVHLERLHTAPSFADTISQKFKRFDRHIGLDCGILECRLRKTRPHLHCRQCYRQISPFDLETHICGNIEYRPMSLSPTKQPPTFYSSEQRRSEQHLQQPPEISGDNFTIHSAKHLIRDYTSLPSVTFSTLNELRRKVSEMEPEATSTPKRNHEDEKVLVVRAAGTYFPENTNELSGVSPHAQQKLPSSTNATECIQLSRTPSTASYCSTPYCKMKRKPHEHCEFCDQSFVDLNRSRAHRLAHVGTATKPIPSHLMTLQSSESGEDNKINSYMQPHSPMESQPANIYMYEEQPQDLTLSPNPATIPSHDDRTQTSREAYTTPPAVGQPASTPAQFPNIFPPDFICSLSMQNFHLAQLAALYQQNPYYYQHLYPFLSNAAAFSRHQQNRQAQPCQVPSNDDKSYFPAPVDCPTAPPAISPLLTAVPSTTSGHFPFINPLLLSRSAETATANQQTTAVHVIPPSIPMTSAAAAKSLKRKQSNGSGERFSAIIDALAPSTKKRMQFAAGLAAAAAAAATTSNAPSTSGIKEQHGQHFKIKDEQIPTGYLKFRFNEDCYFPKCGYRNHQSHFHCDRNDCHYSFCDKTRFVQHTARHERLDKLMGNDFRQYRANMNCGYENCPYFKNLGSANKSSHFHCLKCDFICSDTNKVVAHRRQHSKMEYIRMAGFRKVTNSERCNSTFEATVPTNGNELPGTIECSYSQKQTHYHCLVCDVSVLSRAQLASHKHKTP